MPEYVEAWGEMYRKVTVKYTGLRLEALVNENQYKTLYNEKKARKRKRRTPKAILEDKLDTLWSKAVRKRDKICQKCAKPNLKLEAHHIFSRTYLSTRWDMDNGVALCTSCHKFGKGSAHKDPDKFQEWARQVFGDSYYERVKFKAYHGKKPNLEEMEIILENLTSML